MIEDYSRDLLRSGIIELKAGNRETARRYLDRALYMSGDHDVMAEGWYWMSQLTDNPAEKRQALENCLTHDLRHARARRALAVLDGKLKPEDIVDANAPASQAAEGNSRRGTSPLIAREAEAQRFMCAKCGGRMHFAPDGQSLVCDYCTRHLSLQPVSGGRGKSVEQSDFLLTMATVRGQSKPLVEQVFHCQGCAAQFILPPGQISITCPYCGSAHVVSFEKSHDLIAPEGIIPHAFNQPYATAMLMAWLQKNQGRPRSVGMGLRSTSQDPSEGRVDRIRIGTGKLSSPTVPNPPAPRGLYLPLWTFDLGGAIEYTGEVIEQDELGLGRRAPKVVRVTDDYAVMLSRLPIPASRKLSAPFVHLLPTYNFKAVQPYDPRYLADWPAELYDIPMAEASLDARSQGFAILKRDMTDRLSPMHLISASSSNLTIDSFRLNLVPVWMTEVIVHEAAHLVLVNGQTGDVYGDLASRPSHSGNVLSLLADLL